MELRIVYFLEPDARRRLQVTLGYTSLLKWAAFKPWDHRLEKILGKVRNLDVGERRLIYRLLQYQSSAHPDTAVLEGCDGYEIAREVVETRRAFWEGGNRLRLHWGAPVTVTPSWKVDSAGVGQAVVEGVDAPLLSTTPALCMRNDGNFDCLHPLSSPWREAALSAWIHPGFSEQAAADAFLTTFINRFPDALPNTAGNAGPATAIEKLAPTPVLRWIFRQDAPALAKDALLAVDGLAVLRVQFRYGHKLIDWSEERSRIALRPENGPPRVVARAFDFEQSIMSQLRGLGLDNASAEGAASLFDFHANDLACAGPGTPTLESLLSQTQEMAERNGWEFESRLDADTLKLQERSCQIVCSADKRGWFHLSANLFHEGEAIPLLPLLRNFLRTHRDCSDEELREIFSCSTFVVSRSTGSPPMIIPGQALRLLAARVFELRTSMRLDSKGRMRVSRWRATELASQQDLCSDSSMAIRVPAEAQADHITQAWRRWKDHISGGAVDWPEWTALPPGLEALRSYQRSALGWMRFLRETGTHGILADDMGLGKTFQILASLECERLEGVLKGPVLIVCPTSVIGNWVSEARRRTPGFVVKKHHGADRDRTAAGICEGASAIVTSYALLREDASILTGIEWHCVVLDEAQAIKNPRSETHKIACSLRANRRLCVTGTPVENNLGELWALFEFLMPFYLGARDTFREDYEKPVAESGARERKRLLHQLSLRVRPFMLRRTKDRVAPELPPRTEIVHTVELTPAQAQCYEAVRIAATRDLRKLFEERGLRQSHMHVLSTLTQLRLICCDPRLGNSATGDIALTEADSAKLQRLLELLEELIGEGRRCLIFSQFTKVLDLVEPALRKQQWEFLRLDGATRNRTELVEAFERGAAPLLLISLRAGGSGLNLTSADTVIHFDPWWNPAVEEQATSRAHRIGQDKPVFVHRLVTSGTVESAILELHEEKRSLVENLIEVQANALIDPQVIARLLGESESSFTPKSSA